MSRNVFDSILGTIGNTPLVRLNRITREVKATVYAKIETFNPGNSIKDRMALRMIEDAERSGALKPGGTIIEGTSGNTGMGLAIAAIVKGYRCIFTTTDKQSKEKIDALRAFGAEVIVCPTDVDPEDPRSYYSVSSRLVKETPNGWKANQYDNLSNAQAHYETTGPEIWEQTEGRVDHLVAGVGTGGTICGVGRYLKEKKPAVKVWGIDTYGSVFKKYKETGVFDKQEIYPYVTEGIGEDFLPQNVDFSVIDHFEKVTDRDAAIYTLLPPQERRGLILIDSSFDRSREFSRLLDAIAQACRRFATGVYAIWYPLMDPAVIRGFERDMVRTGLRKVLRLELALHPDNWQEGMRGSAMLVINPPFGLDETARDLLPWLWSVLSPEAEGRHSVRWLVEE